MKIDRINIAAQLIGFSSKAVRLLFCIFELAFITGFLFILPKFHINWSQIDEPLRFIIPLIWNIIAHGKDHPSG
ncbi:hypothetical protein [Paenibacillus pseudetheri]|uniref:hypothetical protein n=1 Tax=Paenibacillus pseudetheri TaxID=2897682 RepID=UPI001F1C0E60|nr:hypothetical protein [Paenibacillus pseudetheri]